LEAHRKDFLILGGLNVDTANTYGRTGEGGEFTVELPEKAKAAQLIVSPPGYALKAFNVAVDEAPAVLRVGSEAGDLEVESPYSREEVEGRFVLQIFQDGIPLSTGDLLQWTLAHGKEFTNPERTRIHAAELAPGDYLVCLVPRDGRAPAGQNNVPAGAACSSGTLTPGAVLRLQLKRSSGRD